MNTGDSIIIDALSQDSLTFTFHRNIIQDVDGRQSNFWRLERKKYQYYYYRLGRFVFFQLGFFIEPGYTLYTQYYSYGIPVTQRNLNATSITNVNKTTTKEQQNDGIFNLFYIISQLGGLYSFLACIMGFFMYPLGMKMLQKDLVYDFKNKSDKVFQDPFINKNVSLRLNPIVFTTKFTSVCSKI